MQNQSAFSKDFRFEAKQIFDRQGEFLLLIHYPSSAGNRDYFYFTTFENFQDFLSQRKAKERLFIFKATDVVKRGKASEEFISEVVDSLEQPKNTDWLIIFPPGNYDRWQYCEDMQELLQELWEYQDQQVVIMEDPLYQASEDMVIAYVPDSDGVVRPGVY